MHVGSLLFYILCDILVFLLMDFVMRQQQQVTNANFCPPHPYGVLYFFKDR